MSVSKFFVDFHEVVVVSFEVLIDCECFDCNNLCLNDFLVPSSYKNNILLILILLPLRKLMISTGYNNEWDMNLTKPQTYTYTYFKNNTLPLATVLKIRSFHQSMGIRCPTI